MTKKLEFEIDEFTKKSTGIVFEEKYSELDLRICEYGDTLITKHGTKMFYVRPLEEDNYFDHEVAYLDSKLGSGTRTHNGQMFRKNRREEDEDIVQIIKLKRL